MTRKRQACLQFPAFNSSSRLLPRDTSDLNMSDSSPPTGGELLQMQNDEHPIRIEDVPSSHRQDSLPCPDLLDDDRNKKYDEICVPLYEASIRGDWIAAEAILDIHPEMVRFSITQNYDTALHIAASSKNSKRAQFVQNLVNLMTNEDLELKNKNSNTVMCIAAAAGNVEIAKIILERNPNLSNMPGSFGMMPLYMAALFGHRDMVTYLYSISEKMTDDLLLSRTLLECVEFDLFDVALQILKDHPELANNGDLLRVLARKPGAFAAETNLNFAWKFFNSNKVGDFAQDLSSEAVTEEDLHPKIDVLVTLCAGATIEKENHALMLLRMIWKRIIQNTKSSIDGTIRGPRSRDGDDSFYPSRVLFVAVEMGNTEFVTELIRQYPDLIWKLNDEGLSIFHVAVANREEGIYSLLYKIGSMKDLITPLKDEDDNNMLHLVGKTAKVTSGAALQMQQDLLWFKEVETMVPPSYLERKNKAGLTPYELFAQEHIRILSNGQNYMKETASQCMLVATLIATVVYAAAFTVPGGYNQENGIPIFKREASFIVFVISNAIALFCSSTSILVFLSMLTSPYANYDALKSLNKMLMIGLATLFLSITTMMISFAASFFVLYHNHFKWVPILITIVAAIPVMLFIRLQFPLVSDMYQLTYGARHRFKPKKHRLYY